MLPLTTMVNLLNCYCTAQPFQETTAGPVMEEPGPRYEDAPFGIFVRFGGGRGGFWFRYKGHVRHTTLRRQPTINILP